MARGQAALEFLMTYGWAILVVLAAIGALAYFGVLKPDRFLPEKCSMPPGIDCAGHLIQENASTLVLRNGAGKDLTVSALSVEGCNATFVPVTEFDNGELTTLKVTGCSNGDSGDKFKGTIYLTFTEVDVNLTKTWEGSVITKVQGN